MAPEITERQFNILARIALMRLLRERGDMVVSTADGREMLGLSLSIRPTDDGMGFSVRLVFPSPVGSA